MSNREIVTRYAQECDAEKMIHLHFSAVRQISQNFYTQAQLESWSPTPNPSRYEWMCETIRSQSTVVLASQLGDEVCGFVICSLREGFIRALYVSPSSSRRGIGKSLLSLAENHLVDEGSVLAKLNSSLNAVEFYRSAGYSVIQPTTQQLDDGTEIDCYEMQKVIASTA